jgi:hypothetical protein
MTDIVEKLNQAIAYLEQPKPLKITPPNWPIVLDLRECRAEIERLRTLLQRHDHDLSDAEDLLLEIANSMEKDFIDPVAHVDWCMNAAKKYLIERAARVKR